MARDDRLELIRQIEQRRGSRVLVYVTGDRQNADAQMGGDAVRPIFEHVRAIRPCNKLDVFVYSRGGALNVPWPLANAFRNAASGSWNVLVPYKAHSAATLLSLGADEIVMGAHGELGPIDPIMTATRAQPGGPPIQDRINVEDVMAYVRFVRERAGLSDQAALAEAITQLTGRLDAVALGSVHRTHSHIRDVARRMLLSRKEVAGEQALQNIVETLAERVYAHDHAIAMPEAADIGLPVKAADDDLDDLMWALLEQYEDQLKLREPFDPQALVQTSDVHQEDCQMAVVESTDMTHFFVAMMRITAQRQLPQQLNVALNLTMNLPAAPGGKVPPQQALQQELQRAQQMLQPLAQQAAQEALRAQAPVIGTNLQMLSPRWVKDGGS